MLCSNCGHENRKNSNFCGKCGVKLKSQKAEESYTKILWKIGSIFFILLAYIILFQLLDIELTYKVQLVIELFFALIVVVYYFLDFKSINKLLSVKNLKISVIIKILIALPLFALFISFFADFLNKSLYLENVGYFEFYLDSPAPILLSLVSVALFPAIFEEIAFRAVVFNELIKITALKPAIIISAILFTMLHISILSIFWIFPLSLLFGYLRARYRNLWYGIIGHFIYNATVVMIEIYGYYFMAL